MSSLTWKSLRLEHHYDNYPALFLPCSDAIFQAFSLVPVGYRVLGGRFWFNMCHSCGEETHPQPKKTKKANKHKNPTTSPQNLVKSRLKLAFNILSVYHSNPSVQFL